MKSFFREGLITVVLAIVIFFIAQNTIKTYEVFMVSMEPNFYEGNRVVVNRVVYWFGEPERGDVIIFDAPHGSDEDFIKRIIGLPGDIVEIKNQAVYIHDIKLEEPYIEDPPRYEMEKIEVPEESYFVLGDNRNHSNDSHNNWFVAEKDIHGKAWLLTWPPEIWGIVPRYPLSEQLANADS